MRAFLTLVTINVWSGLNYQGVLRVGSLESPGAREERYQRLLAGLRELAPDVVAINEANPVKGYMERLARDLGYDAFWHPGLSGLRCGPLALPVNLLEGDGLLARPELELHGVGRVQLSGGPVGRHFSFNFTNATQVVGARIRLGGRFVYLLATHWSVANSAQDYALQEGCREGTTSTARVSQTHQEAARRRRRESLRTLVAARSWVPEGEAAVLLGDLNASPDSPELELWRGGGWVDAFAHLHPDKPGYTWDQGNNQQIQAHYPAARDGAPVAERVDYVLVNGVLGGDSIQSAEVVLDRAPHPSDHFGVAVALRMPAPR